MPVIQGNHKQYSQIYKKTAPLSEITPIFPQPYTIAQPVMDTPPVNSTKKYLAILLLFAHIALFPYVNLSMTICKKLKMPAPKKNLIIHNMISKTTNILS